MVGEPLRSLRAAAQLQPAGVGAQRHGRALLAAAQRAAAAALAGGPVVRGGVPGRRAGVRAGAVPLRQPEGGLQCVSGLRPNCGIQPQTYTEIVVCSAVKQHFWSANHSKVTLTP